MGQYFSTLSLSFGSSWISTGTASDEFGAGSKLWEASNTATGLHLQNGVLAKILHQTYTYGIWALTHPCLLSKKQFS